MKSKQIRFYLKLLASILIVTPYAFMIVLSIIYAITNHDVMVDVFMPFELGFILVPGIVIGSIMVWLEHKHRTVLVVLVSVLLVSALATFFIPQWVGFASDDDLAHGFWFILTWVFVGVFDLTGLLMGIGMIFTIKRPSSIEDAIV